MDIFKQFLNFNINNNLIFDSDKLIVSFSGGPDSVFLTEMLLKLKKEIAFEFVLVHINHLLRGESSDKDELFSIEYGKNKNLKVYSFKIDVSSLAREKKISLEEAGRIARYECLEKILKQESANKIALAHNKDDQIETFLFRLIRGTSLSGLEGIKIKRDYFIRPISEFYKLTILNYLKKNKIHYRIDETNEETEFTRNSIRLELIPFIEKKYNPSFKEKIFNLIKEIRICNSFINNNLKTSFTEDTLDKGDAPQEKVKRKDMRAEITDKNTLNVEDLLELEDYLKSVVIKNFLIKNGIMINRKKILSILSILNSGGSKEIRLNEEFILRKEYNILKILNIKTENFNNDIKIIDSEKIDFKDIKFEIPGSIRVGNYLITAELIEKKINKNRLEKVILDKKEFKGDKNIIYTTLKKGNTLTIRTRHEQDKMSVEGLLNPKKIKDIFINDKIPKNKRNQIPILLYEGEIIWIVGVRQSSSYKLLNHELFDNELGTTFKVEEVIN